MRSPFFNGKIKCETLKGMEQPLKISSRKVIKEKRDLSVNIIVSNLGDWIHLMANVCQYVLQLHVFTF